MVLRDTHIITLQKDNYILAVIKLMIHVLQSSLLTLKVNDGVLTCAAPNEATKHQHDVFNAVLLRPQAATNGNA